jgi:hypothetical protein
MAEQCTAKSKQTGKPCGFPPVPGATVCRYHGGLAPQVQAKAQERIEAAEAAEAARSFGLPVEVDPQQAIIQELHRTAGVVAWLGQIVGDLDRDRIAQGVSKIETRTGFQAGRAVTVEAQVNVWVRLWQDERKHLAQVAAAAHKTGIDVAQTKIAETTAQMLVACLTRVFDRLALSDQQQQIAAQAVPEVLRSLGTGQEAAA